MTNLEDWVHGIESWGFRVVDYDEDTMYFRGTTHEDDRMVTYRVAPGVFTAYIHIKNGYHAENSVHSGRSGFRISYCRNGNYCTHINKSKIVVTSGEVFVGKAVPASRESYGSQKEILGFTIVVAPNEIEGRSFLKEQSLKFIEAVKDIQNIGFMVKSGEAVSLARELIDALAEEDRGAIGLVTFQLMDVISKERVSVNRRQYFKNSRDESVEAIEAYLRDHLSEHITLEMIEATFQCSKSTIINRFIRRFQYPPMKYLANLRMMEAERLLIESDATMTFIAESVGYDNPSNFARAFKQFTGMSPREYRKCYGQSEKDTKK